MLARKYNAEISGSSNFYLSPLSYLNRTPTTVVLVSPNGALCCRLASGTEYAFIGSFLNAKAVARCASGLSKAVSKDITIIAAGETMSDKNGSYFCLEDLLGAGGIISEMDMDKTEQALNAENRFNKMAANLLEVISTTASGRHLLRTKRQNEVVFCCQLNKYSCVPQIVNDKIAQFGK